MNEFRFPHGILPAKSGDLPRIAGILNLSSDSFSGDGSSDFEARAAKILADGAAMIDLGAESTRPGASELAAEKEKELLLPAVKRIRELYPEVPLSVDTRKASVADAVLTAGADMVNDVSGLQFDPEMAHVIASHPGAGLILMHMRGIPSTMQNPENLVYTDPVSDILRFFDEAMAKAVRAGVPRESIWLDPGIGFSKNTEQNLELIRRAGEFKKAGRPLYYGVSRKRFIGELTGVKTAADRDFGTAGVLAYLAEAGVDFVRVHNVAGARDSMKMFGILKKSVK